MNKETIDNINNLQELIKKDCNCANCKYLKIYLNNKENKIDCICSFHDCYISDLTPCLDYKI